MHTGGATVPLSLRRGTCRALAGRFATTGLPHPSHTSGAGVQSSASAGVHPSPTHRLERMAIDLAYSPQLILPPVDPKIRAWIRLPRPARQPPGDKSVQ